MHDSVRAIVKYVVVGLVTTGVLVGAVYIFEHTEYGHRVESLTFELLQGQLSSFNPNEELPIVVVDISRLPGGRDRATSRSQLQEIIETIAVFKPTGVGVDVDFSPEEDNLITDQDQAFLDRCLKLTEDGTPIFLAVGRRMGAKPSAWLGAEKYQKMAATPAIRNADTKRVPLWIKRYDLHERLPSLSYALAQTYRLSQPPTWMEWMLETSVERHPSPEFDLADAPVNYSKLEAIEQQALLTTSRQSISESGVRFRERMVIIGDGTPELASDNLPVPGRDRLVPGVYLHASAAYTFTREPLSEIKLGVRLLLDFVLSSLVLIAVAVDRYRHLGRNHPLQWKRRQRIAFTLTAAGALVLGALLVRFAGVLWLDLLLVALALLLHPRVESWLDTLEDKLHQRRRAPGSTSVH